jgi:hypothetical protein
VWVGPVAQAILEYVWPYPLASVVGGGGLLWYASKVLKSRTADSVDRTVAGSVEAAGVSRSLRDEGVPEADRHKLIMEVWRRNLDLRDPRGDDDHFAK